MWHFEPGAELPLWRPRESPRGARLAFTTRRGGVSAAPYDSLNLGKSTADAPEAVETNRARVLAAMGVASDRVATAGQVHGATVTPVRAPGLHRDCDALVTTERGLALAVAGADCLPILFTAPGAVAAAHAGWRGVAAGVPVHALRALCGAAGVRPDAVHVSFGPCIRPCCYEVGPEVAERFPGDAVTRLGNVLRLDVATAARRLLLDAGVPAPALHDVAECTACRADRYFSHRRDRGITGRQWGLVVLEASA